MQEPARTPITLAELHRMLGRKVTRGKNGRIALTTPQLEIILSPISVEEIRKHVDIQRDTIRRIRNQHGMYITRGKKVHYREPKIPE